MATPAVLGIHHITARDHLGDRLMLPSWLDAHRAAGEAAPPPLTLPAPRAAE